MKLEINEKISGTYLDLLLENQVNLFDGDSGTGKTYLFDLLSYYCLRKNIIYTLVNYTLASKPASSIIELCNNSDIVVFDNADLYLTADMLDTVKASAKIIIVCLKDAYGICTKPHLCKIKYTAGKMIVR
jgi:hypothetical protein